MFMHQSATLVRSRVSWVLGQAALVGLGVFIYFRVRGLTQASVGLAEAHAHHIVAFEKFFGLDIESNVQSLASQLGLATLFNWVYIWGHWPAIATVMIWTAWHHRAVFLRLRDAMMVSGLLGMAVFVSYPVAPPRLAGLGLQDTVLESSRSYRVLQPPAFVNQYAAMPSLHVGWDLLVGIAIVSAAGSIGLKLVGFAMPVLMGLAVVATANHYLVDVVAGVSLVLLGHAVALQLEKRRARQPVLLRR